MNVLNGSGKTIARYVSDAKYVNTRFVLMCPVCLRYNYNSCICVFQRNREIRTLKHGLEHYDLHHAIFGSSLATGNYAVPSSDPYLNRHDGDSNYSSGNEEIDACTMDTGPRSEDKRASSSKGGNGNKKRGKTKVDYMAKIDRMCDIYIADHEKDVTSQQSRHTGPVTDLMDQIIEVVTGLFELDN